MIMQWNRIGLRLGKKTCSSTFFLWDGSGFCRSSVQVKAYILSGESTCRIFWELLTRGKIFCHPMKWWICNLKYRIIFKSKTFLRGKKFFKLRDSFVVQFVSWRTHHFYQIFDFNPLKAALATFSSSFDKTFKPIVTHEIHELHRILHNWEDFLVFNFTKWRVFCIL